MVNKKSFFIQCSSNSSSYLIFHTVLFSQKKKRTRIFTNITLSYKHDAEKLNKKIHRQKNIYVYIIAQNKIFNVRNYTNIATSFLGVIGIDEGRSVS